jgi:hypothetical protein
MLETEDNSHAVHGGCEVYVRQYINRRNEKTPSFAAVVVADAASQMIH